MHKGLTEVWDDRNHPCIISAQVEDFDEEGTFRSSVRPKSP